MRCLSFFDPKNRSGQGVEGTGGKDRVRGGLVARREGEDPEREAPWMEVFTTSVRPVEDDGTTRGTKTIKHIPAPPKGWLISPPEDVFHLITYYNHPLCGAGKQY